MPGPTTTSPSLPTYQEIVARLRALIRRSAGKPSPTLVHNDIELSPASGTVTVAGKPSN